MPTVTYGESAVPVDDEGFFTDPARWTEPMAEQIARESGIEALTDRHWT
ncbi:TusE/DsrC/DsvC family sulfur relay protein, partial [Streptomyces sp. NPDC101225]